MAATSPEAALIFRHSTNIIRLNTKKGANILLVPFLFKYVILYANDCISISLA